MPEFNTEEKNLMLIQSLTFFASALAGIFVTVFFFANSNFQTTVIFNLATYASLLFFYLFGAWLMRYVSSALLMNIGVVTAAVFYLLMFVLKSQAVLYAIPLGLFWGFSAGFYWVGYNLNQYIFTNKGMRVEYFGSINGILNLLQSAAPLLGGLIISIGSKFSVFNIDPGYASLFFLVFLFLMVTVLVVGKLPSHEIPNFSFRDILFHRRSKVWVNILCQQAVMGFYDVALGTVASVLLFLIVKNEVVLGTTQTVGFFLAAVGSLLSIRILKKNGKYFWLGVAGLVIGNGMFALWQNWTGVFFYIILTGLFAPFLNNWFGTVFYHAVDAVPGTWENKFHFLIERDIALGIPRILSYILLWIFLGFGDQVTIAKTWLYITPVMPLILGLLLSRSGD